MTLSVQIAPLLKSRVEEEAHRRGVSPSAFVPGILERALGMKSPAEIDRRVCRFTSMSDPDAK